jgi:hypothetical protein
MEPQKPTRAERNALTYSKRLPFYDTTEALFAAWAEEDETGDSRELARRDAEWEALKARLNENRVAAGEEPLF